MQAIPSLTSSELQDLAGDGYRLAWRMLHHREDAADAVQDALFRLVGRQHQFDSDRGTLRGWFFRIVRNRCIDLQRRHRGGQSTQVATLPDPSAIPACRTAEQRELVDAVRRAMNELPESSREILLLRDFHGLTYAEISDVLGIASGTVMSRLHRARQQLKERVEPELRQD